MGRCVLVLASVRGLVRGMVPAGAYWRLLVRVLVSGLACGTLSVDGSVCDDFPCGVLEIVGNLGGLWEITANRPFDG